MAQDRRADGEPDALDPERATHRARRTRAQILATETGIPSDLIQIEEGNTDTAPYGLGTYGSRSTPVAGAAAARVGRKIRAKAQKIAAHMLEVAEEDLECNLDRLRSRACPRGGDQRRRSPGRPITVCPRALSPGSRRSTTMTLRT